MESSVGGSPDGKGYKFKELDVQTAPVTEPLETQSELMIVEEPVPF